MRYPDYEVVETLEKFSGGRQWRLEILRDNTSNTDNEPFRVRLYRRELFDLNSTLSNDQSEGRILAGPYYIWVEGDPTWPNFCGETTQRALSDALMWLEMYDH